MAYIYDGRSVGEHSRRCGVYDPRSTRAGQRAGFGLVFVRDHVGLVLDGEGTTA